MKERIYIAIDLKSFYASVECRERKRDPMTTNLVVADSERTDKTICLAVSPSLKACGISGRARLFEVVAKVREVNAQRLARAGIRSFRGSSDDARQLEDHPDLMLDYITAPPRMAERGMARSMSPSTRARAVSRPNCATFCVAGLMVSPSLCLSDIYSIL